MPYSGPKAPLDPVAYRQMLRAAFIQVRQHVARDMSEPDAGQLARHLDELRRLVYSFAAGPIQGEPAIASELHDTYSIGLNAIDDRISAGDVFGAARLAERLLTLIAFELTWMAVL